MGGEGEIKRSIFKLHLAWKKEKGEGRENSTDGKGRTPANGKVVGEAHSDSGRRGEAGITWQVVEDCPP